MYIHLKKLSTLIASILTATPVSVLALIGMIPVWGVFAIFGFSMVAGFTLLKKHLAVHQELLSDSSKYEKLNLKKDKHKKIYDLVIAISKQLKLPKPNILIKNRENDLPFIGISCANLPEYTIIINRDLLTLYPKSITDNQLRLLLAHEFGHFFHFDHQYVLWLRFCKTTLLMQALGVFIFTLPLGLGILFSALLGLGLCYAIQNLMIQSHSRHCEFTADEFAVQFNQDPKGMINLFDHILKQYQYWGMLMFQNQFAENQIYSDNNLSPLLQKLHKLEAELEQEMESNCELTFEVQNMKQQIEHYLPNFEQKDSNDKDSFFTQSLNYIKTFFNDCPTNLERQQKIRTLTNR